MVDRIKPNIPRDKIQEATEVMGEIDPSTASGEDKRTFILANIYTQAVRIADALEAANLATELPVRQPTTPSTP